MIFWIKGWQMVLLPTLMTLICRQRKYHHIADCPMSSSSHFCFRLVNEIDELNECTCVWHETAHHDQFLKFLSENSQFQAFKMKKMKPFYSIWWTLFISWRFEHFLTTYTLSNFWPFLVIVSWFENICLFYGLNNFQKVSSVFQITMINSLNFFQKIASFRHLRWKRIF